MDLPKCFVYVLRSAVDPARYYVGLTSDVAERLRIHNQGLSGHTVQDRPWQLVVAVEFTSQESAVRFEKYL
jgi:putative endonuclease